MTAGCAQEPLCEPKCDLPGNGDGAEFPEASLKEEVHRLCLLLEHGDGAELADHGVDDDPGQWPAAGQDDDWRGRCGGAMCSVGALASGDPEHFGATVHLVDQGVDTGGILYWQRVTPGRDDNFVTYPFRLAASGRALVLRAIDDALTGQLRTIDITLPSQQWYHPTLWGYLGTGLRRGVW